MFRNSTNFGLQMISTCRHPECSTETTFGLSGCTLRCLGEKGGSWLLVSSADCFQHFYKPSSSASSSLNIENHKPKPEKLSRFWLESDFVYIERMVNGDRSQNVERTRRDIMFEQWGVNGFDLYLCAAGSKYGRACSDQHSRLDSDTSTADCSPGIINTEEKLRNIRHSPKREIMG